MGTPGGVVVQEGIDLLKEGLARKLEADQSEKSAQAQLKEAQAERAQAEQRIQEAAEATATAEKETDKSRQREAAMALREAELEWRQRALESGAQMEQEAQAAGQPLGAYVLARAERSYAPTPSVPELLADLRQLSPTSSSSQLALGFVVERPRS